MSRIVAMNIAPLTTRGHSPITMDFHTTQLQITHRLHFPSSTAPTQLFTIITLAPVFHLTITITQSHTHTHTLLKLWTFSHSLPSIVSLSAYKAFPQFTLFDSCVPIPARVPGLFSLPCPLDIVRRSPTHACPWIILVSCPCHTCLLLSDPACIDHVL